MIRRPRYRGECVNGLRPCPWVSCRHHLAHTERYPGILLREPDDLEETCTLDVADRGALSLREVGDLMGLSYEHVRLIESEAATHARALLGAAGYVSIDGENNSPRRGDDMVTEQERRRAAAIRDLLRIVEDAKRPSVKPRRKLMSAAKTAESVAGWLATSAL